MKRSVQEIVELLVFGLIALLIGTGLLWLVGWIFDLAGVLFKFFAALIWSLLRFIVPVAVGAAIVYALVRLVQQQREKSVTGKSTSATKPDTSGPTLPAGTTSTTEPPGTTSTTEPAGASDTAAPGTASPSAAPAVDYTEENLSQENESHPTTSEVWVPPQPAPPTEAGPAEPESGALGHEPTVEETTGPSSVPPADDDPVSGETPLEERLEEAARVEDSSSVHEDDESDDDERHS